MRERERGFWLAMQHGKSGEAPSSMEQGLCVLECQAMASMCVEVKREKLQAHHGSLVYFAL